MPKTYEVMLMLFTISESWIERSEEPMMNMAVR